MSLELLREITNNFSEERKLGSGTYGEVFKGVHNREDVAVKRLHLMPGSFNELEQFKNEFENLNRLRHENIVRLLGYCYETRNEYVVLGDGRTLFAENIHRALCFEYMDNGSLQNYLTDEYDGLDWRTSYKIIKGICKGLRYLHEELESPIYHLDLKPDNILLDKDMVPKLADFGLSKLVHNDQTQATRSSIGTMGYMPPEYINGNLVSKKLDIFSLGVVMIRIMTGFNGYFKIAEMSSEEFIDLVHTNWRNRLQATPGCTSLEDECHQVKRCTEIALDCVKADRKQRPEIGAIIHQLNETEHLNEKLTTNLPYEMTHDTMSHVDKTCNFVSEVPPMVVSAAPSPLQKIITMPVGPAMTTSEITSIGSSDISKLLSVHPLDLLFHFTPKKIIQCPVSLTNRTDFHVGVWITLTSSSEYFSDGVYECLSPFVIVEPQCSQSVTMIMKEQQRQPLPTMDRFEVLIIVMGSVDDLQLLKSPTGSKLNTDEIFLKQVEESGGNMHRVILTPIICDPAQEAASRQSISPLQRIISVLKGPGETTSEIRCIEPSKASKLLDVHPLELRFPFERKKVMECPVTLINMTDNYVGVWITVSDQSTLSGFGFPCGDPHSSLFRSIMPHSSLSIAVTVEKQKVPPRNTGEYEVVMIVMRTKEDLEIIKSSIVRILDMDRNFWKIVETLGAEVHRAMLSAIICDPASCQPVIDNQYLPTPPRSEFGVTSCIDVHPTKKWILVGQDRGCISIFNYEKLFQHQQTYVVLQIQVPAPLTKRILSYITSSSSGKCNIVSAKFIAREEWFAAGDHDGRVHVYSYITKDKITEVGAYDHGKPVWLAVHPTLSFVLTSSSHDNWIKLWDWSEDWKCIRQFDNEDSPSRIQWNPWDAETFLGASGRCIKVWRLGSSDPVTALKGSNQVPCCFYSDNHRNFVATCYFRGYKNASYLHSTEILDMQTNERVHQLAVANDQYIMDVACHPTLPLLATISNESFCLWNTSTYRLEKMFDIVERPVVESCMELTGITDNVARIVTGHRNGISVMQINFSKWSSAISNSQSKAGHL